MEYWLAFLIGFFGSMHCIGMCGPIVLAYTTHGMQQPPSLVASLSSHLTYNAGRVLSYTLVGGILGALGGGVAAIEGVAFWFSLLSGVLLILLGLSLIKRIPWLPTPMQKSVGGASLSDRFYRATFGALITQRTLESKFMVGLLTSLLPCGLLYPMFLKAASSGSALSGALTMFWFGVGIIPALMATGLAGSFLGAHVRRWGTIAAALVILLMGMVLILRAFGAHG
jgi:sulfite exporter TauE/SafE